MKGSFSFQHLKPKASASWSHFPRTQFIVTLFSARSGHSIASLALCAQYVGQSRNEARIATPRRHGNAIRASGSPPLPGPLWIKEPNTARTVGFILLGVHMPSCI
jgi:hypothetical protein